jgi:hypothetical protein
MPEALGVLPLQGRGGGPPVRRTAPKVPLLPLLRVLPLLPLLTLLTLLPLLPLLPLLITLLPLPPLLPLCSWFALRTEAEDFFNMPITPQACPRIGTQHYQRMDLTHARMPYNQVPFVVPDDSPDRIEPIPEARYDIR